MFNTPILFLIFNRPDTTRQVFEAIRRVRPKQLFIAADGPRLNRPADIGKCRVAQEIALQVDWDCEVKTLFRDKNLGCKYAVSSGIDWFFNYVEEGIILEDDCLPDLSFFKFCEELLNYHRDNKQVMHISGSNWQLENKRSDFSYYYSKYPHIWGWATWRRAWKLYDVKMKEWPTYKKAPNFKAEFISKQEYICWKDFFEDTYRNKVDTWDTQWFFSVWANNGMCITPEENLIKNIGIGVPDATHTTYEDDIFSKMHVSEINSELSHPKNIITNTGADVFVFKNYFYKWRKKRSFKRYVHDNVYTFLPEFVKTYYRKLRNNNKAVSC